MADELERRGDLLVANEGPLHPGPYPAPESAHAGFRCWHRSRWCWVQHLCDFVRKQEVDPVSTTHEVARGVASCVVSPDHGASLEIDYLEGVAFTQLVHEPPTHLERLLMQVQDPSVSLGEFTSEWGEIPQIDVVRGRPCGALDHHPLVPVVRVGRPAGGDREADEDENEQDGRTEYVGHGMSC